MTCDCGHNSPSYSVRLTAAGPRTRCRTCLTPPRRGSSVNPFAALTLDHATDEQGQPVSVSSLRQLREAEQRYQFKSLVANERESKFDHPPQQRHQDLLERTTESGGWLYPEIAEQQIRELREQGEI